jgi:raffinose/stachyose/melibiose transport system permease protein
LMIIYIAGFMSVPKELIEASNIDGANRFEKLKSVTIPLMVPSLIVCSVISISRGFMAFDLNLALTNGEPYGSTQLLALHIYNQAFSSQQFGSGQAEAVILFLIVSIISVTLVYFSKKLEVEA